MRSYFALKEVGRESEKDLITMVRFVVRAVGRKAKYAQGFRSCHDFPSYFFRFQGWKGRETGTQTLRSLREISTPPLEKSAESKPGNKKKDFHTT